MYFHSMEWCPLFYLKKYIYFFLSFGTFSENKNLLFFQDLLSVHDTVAQKEYEPKLPSLAAEDHEDEEDSVRIIQLMKSKEPLVSLSFWGT